MIELIGKHNRATVYCDEAHLDKETKKQICALLRETAYADSRIRVMPDTHAGRGCVIGLTMTLSGRVSPSLVGVDMGCGMEVVALEARDLDLPRLDALIRDRIPAGRQIHDTPTLRGRDFPIESLLCARALDTDRIRRSMGTLGGGNHFIEVDRGEDGALYLVIHSGSRSLGAAVTNFYRDTAYEEAIKRERRANRLRVAHEDTDPWEDMEECPFVSLPTPRTKASRRETQARLPVKWETALCKGELYRAYLHDLSLAVVFAEENRRAMAEAICEGLGLSVRERFSCVHNYVETGSLTGGDDILRKGAISARQGERVLIPLNMRDGALLCRGLGNPEWNFSAPHGAGRACSRTDARHAYTVEEYKAEMARAGIYTTTADKSTLDECPMAYKAPDRILPHLGECVTVEERLTPIYNFKAGE